MATLVDAVNYIGICKAGSAHGRWTGAWRWRWWGRSPTNKDSGSTWRPGTKTRMGGIVEQERRVPPCARGGAAHRNKQKQTQEDVNGIMRYESTGREASMKKEKSRESPFYRKSDPEGSREVKRAEKWREKGSEERMSWREKGSEKKREVKKVGKWKE